MILDRLKRPMADLRISVTDRCNYRCSYCMPSARYEWIDRSEILTYEEIVRLAAIFADLGVQKIRITGGEPLLRRDLPVLVARLAGLEKIAGLSLTTNGSLLGESAPALAEAGLDRVNVSLDTLNAEKFKRITRRDDLNKVLEGLSRAREHGLRPVKINTVVERGLNDDEIIPMVEFARRNGFPIRFIEYMDVGNANDWRMEKIVPKQEILERLGAACRLEEIGRNDGSAPSVEYKDADGGVELGIIASITEPFCRGCTRMRLTADGKLVTCLFSERGYDIKGLLRSGANDGDLRSLITETWSRRKDRYSEERFEALRSTSGYQTQVRRKIEMIRLGG
ncbi:MAG: GTP 3',8-cyclase MoaA [Acidobacteria bacterium]|nr:GTP 3',8-cyclase MoaA [Acidobacteriota bacterium]